MPIFTSKRAGATIAAGIMVFAVLTGCSASTETSGGGKTEGGGDNIVVATVSGAPVYKNEVTDAARMIGQIGEGETLSTDEAVFGQVLSEVIDQRLLALKAKADGLDKTPEAKHRLAMARERILANIAVGARIEDRVTPDAVKALYAEQIKLRQTGREARASHILFKTEKEAKAAVKRIEAGEDFAALATELSLDRGSQISGGDLGYFQADAMVPEFSKVVFALETGESSDPFESQFGWHIAKLTDKRAAPAPSFEQMEGEVTNFLTMDEISKLITELREEADIVIKTGSEPQAAASDIEAESPAANDPEVAPETQDETDNEQ